MAAPNFFIQRTPLPPNPIDQPPCQDAYDCCLQSQSDAGDDLNRLMYARCLGHLLREAPEDSARNILAHEINQCVIKRVNIDELALFYINHLFRLFRQNKGHTPTPSEHPSRPSFEMHSNLFAVVAEPAPRCHATAKQSVTSSSTSNGYEYHQSFLKALKRDGYRCMITRAADYTTYMSMTDAQRQEHGLAGGGGFTRTNFCHIFPPSINWDLNPEEHGHPKYSGNLWGIVNSFGSIDVLGELSGANLHRLSNGLTMDNGLHSFFDDLSLWFEAVPDTPNTYTIRTAAPIWMLANLPNPLVVTFTTTDDSLELPDPKYLRIHAAVCRVAHMSGAAGYLDLHDREDGEKNVMAYDGSSADLLVSRLSRVALVA